MRTDAVITFLEIQMETESSPFGSLVCFTFVDIFPIFPKIDDTIKFIRKQHDINIVDYNYSYEQINENTDITKYEITRH